MSRLQAKVLQYKQRCADLESHMLDSKPLEPPKPVLPQNTALEQAQQHLREVREERIGDLDTALKRLDEERRR